MKLYSQICKKKEKVVVVKGKQPQSVAQGYMAGDSTYHEQILLLQTFQ